jgi:hypothetical protein
VLKGYEETVTPEKLTHVVYDTGTEKKGLSIILGENVKVSWGD